MLASGRIVATSVLLPGRTSRVAVPAEIELPYRTAIGDTVEPEPP